MKDWIAGVPPLTVASSQAELTTVEAAVRARKESDELVAAAREALDELTRQAEDLGLYD